ncbi:phosphoesterase [Bosea sp. Root670]|uniref:metallophosphoesterase family protein n=1 Tax=Bosea sp. Root670 TaxID=1736583 RepID=UPI0007136BBA|nr:YfcE family phosphodiesterase [Bosea sp. Root670]KRE02365.1 phosphoesterase [Bosea sp. Root670]
MKIAIISDIHGNLDALRAFSETYDELWVLGDQVNFGPQPREVIEIIRDRADIAIQGNHDHAVGFDDDSRWTPKFRAIAEATRRHTSAKLSEEQKLYLRELPLAVQAVREGTRFQLVHATPSDPHYGYLLEDADGWAAELESVDADVLLVGHTHMPFIRRIGNKIVVNPGSIGQPRGGKPRPSYAVWQDGAFELRSFDYPIESTVAKLEALGHPPEVEAELVRILREG